MQPADRHDGIRVQGAPGEQPEEREPRDPQAPADGLHRRLGFWQELAGLRQLGEVSAFDLTQLFDDSKRKAQTPRIRCSTSLSRARAAGSTSTTRPFSIKAARSATRNAIC